MENFRVIPTTNGKFAVVKDSEVLHEGMESLQAAEMAVRDLNRFPSERACEQFPNGRWQPQPK